MVVTTFQQMLSYIVNRGYDYKFQNGYFMVTTKYKCHEIEMGKDNYSMELSNLYTPLERALK
jgi:hypothetical protein